MRHRRRIGKVAQAARRRLARLRRLVAGVDPRDVQATERVVAYVTIELLTLWGNFLRSYYLACALNARCGRRRRIRTAVSYASVEDALGAAVRRFNSRAVPLATGKWHR